jgi:mono/diheme cytochrome c family protein
MSTSSHFRLPNRVRNPLTPGRGGRDWGQRLSLGAIACLVFSMLLTSACSQKIDNQPKYIPLRQNPFFADQNSSRPLVDGTVPRGYLESDQAFFTGKMAPGQAGAAPAPPPASSPAQAAQAGAVTGTAAQGTPSETPAQAPSPPAGRVGSPNAIAANLAAKVEPKRPGLVDINYFPIPVTAELVARGHERFNIFCAPCHSQLGDGQGMIVKRGFRQPPSFHIDRLRQAPVGHFFDVVTNGFGAMPDYAGQIPPADRWAIIAYIKALQLSQNATIGDVPADHRADLDNGGQQK